MAFLFVHVDIDECGVDNGGCGHNCTNLIGSHMCSCQAGYALLRDGKKCESMYTATLEQTSLHFDLIHFFYIFLQMPH